MGAAATCTQDGFCSMPDEKETPKLSAEAAKVFKEAVYRCAGISTCGSKVDAEIKLENFFKDADTDHNGQLDRDEIDGLVRRVQLEIPAEYNDIIQTNMKALLLNFAGSPFSALLTVFMQFTAAEKSLLVSKDPKRIVFVGGTGAGKSLLCTVLTGQEVKSSEFIVGDSATSETTACKFKVCHWFGDENEDEFVCIDTPGLDDELGRDELHINMIVDVLQKFKYINSIVFVINGTSLRFSTSMQKMIKKFEDSFDSRFYDHCMLCLTRWCMDEDSIDERDENGLSEESVTEMLNLKIRGSKSLRCSADLPVVFVDSLYKRKDPKNGKKRLHKIQELTTSKVFRTEDLTKVCPEIVEVTNVAQQLQTGTKMLPMQAKTFDIDVTVTAWNIEPCLPDGLTLCPKGGIISGTPTRTTPASRYSLFASSIGGKGEAFVINLEIIHSAGEIKELAFAAGQNIFKEVNRILNDQLDRALDADEADFKVAEARKTGEDLLAVQLKELQREHGEISTFPKILETLQEYFKSEFIKLEKQFLEYNQQCLSIEKAKQGAESNLRVAMLQNVMNTKRMTRLLQNATEAGVDPDLIEKGKSWLADITVRPCENAPYGCSAKVIGRDMPGHENVCLFGLPLLCKESLVGIPGKPSKTPPYIIVEVEDSDNSSWEGVYTWDNGEYYLMNEEEERLQRIRPAVENAAVGKISLEWALTAQTEEDGPQEEILKSSNKSVSALDAVFDGFSLSLPMTYKWPDEPTYQRCPKSSVKLIYFGGKWCPFCPPFTAKLAKFYNSIVAQKGPEALRIIFCSSDKDEKAMLEYYTEEHGDWLAIPFSEKDIKETLSKYFGVSGIPKCLLINNSMKDITEKLDIRAMLEKISPTTGSKQDEDHLRMFYQLDQATRQDAIKALGDDDIAPGDRNDIFCSLRFGYSMKEATLVKNQLKEEYDIHATIIDVPEGEDIAEQVAVKLDEAKMALIFGCETYGFGTVSYSTKQELEFIISEKKPFFFIKMCDQFSEASTRMTLPDDSAHGKWEHGKPMPPNLLADIVKRFEALES